MNIQYKRRESCFTPSTVMWTVVATVKRPVDLDESLYNFDGSKCRDPLNTCIGDLPCRKRGKSEGFDGESYSFMESCSVTGHCKLLLRSGQQRPNQRRGRLHVESREREFYIYCIFTS